MALYFMRHAQTPGNAAQLWVGLQDQPVTEEGKAKLIQAATTLSALAIDYIYTSPLQRAVVTANTVAARQKNYPETRICNALQERDFGPFEGKAKTPESRQQSEVDPSVETLASMRQRLAPVIQEVSALPGNTLLVSHSAVYRCIVQTMDYVAIPPKLELDNAEWVELCARPNGKASVFGEQSEKGRKF